MRAFSLGGADPTTAASVPSMIWSRAPGSTGRSFKSAQVTKSDPSMALATAPPKLRVPGGSCSGRNQKHQRPAAVRMAGGELQRGPCAGGDGGNRNLADAEPVQEGGVSIGQGGGVKSRHRRRPEIAEAGWRDEFIPMAGQDPGRLQGLIEAARRPMHNENRIALPDPRILHRAKGCFHQLAAVLQKGAALGKIVLEGRIDDNSAANRKT